MMPHVQMTENNSIRYTCTFYYISNSILYTFKTDSDVLDTRDKIAILRSHKFSQIDQLMLLAGRQGELSGGMLAWLFCLGRGADLRTTQLMPLPLTISCSSESRLVSPLFGTGSSG